MMMMMMMMMMVSSLTGPGAVLGDLLARLVSPIDPDAEDTQH